MHHTDTLVNYDFNKQSLNPLRSKYGLIGKPHFPPNKKMFEKHYLYVLMLEKY